MSLDTPRSDRDTRGRSSTSSKGHTAPMDSPLKPDEEMVVLPTGGTMRLMPYTSSTEPTYLRRYHAIRELVYELEDENNLIALKVAQVAERVKKLQAEKLERAKRGVEPGRSSHRTVSRTAHRSAEANRDYSSDSSSDSSLPEPIEHPESLPDPNSRLETSDQLLAEYARAPDFFDHSSRAGGSSRTSPLRQATLDRSERLTHLDDGNRPYAQRNGRTPSPPPLNPPPFLSPTNLPQYPPSHPAFRNGGRSLAPSYLDDRDPEGDDRMASSR